MRIQLLSINYAPERTGIAPYSTALARHLSLSHDVTVLTGLPHYPDWRVSPGHRHWRTENTEGSLRVIRLGHYVPKAPTVIARGMYEASWAMRAVATGRRIPTDVVIAVIPALLGAHSAAVIAKHHHAPLGIYVQDVMGAAAAQSGMRGGKSVSGLTSAIEHAVLRFADGVTTIHPRLADELAPSCRVAPNVIYNWTHVKSRPRPGQPLRERFGWRPDDVIALHSGNMGAKQNLEVVIDAARTAEIEERNVRFVLAGGGSQRVALERYAANCRNLSFVGGVDDCDYMDLLGAADVLVVNERPGMREMSLPSKLTSYLVAGRPIVAATDEDSATAQFVKMSGGGVVTPAGDPGLLLDSVSKIAADEMWTAQLTADGLAFAQQQLSEESALERYDAWLDQLSQTSRQLSRQHR